MTNIHPHLDRLISVAIITVVMALVIRAAVWLFSNYPIYP